MRRLGGGVPLSTVCFPVDLLLGVAAWYGAVWARIHVPLPFTRQLLHPKQFETAHEGVLPITALLLVLLYFFGLYDQPARRPIFQLASRLAVVVFLEAVLVASFFFLAGVAFPRSPLILFPPFAFLLLLIWRLALRLIYRSEPLRVVVVGNGREARELAQVVQEHHWHGLEIVGHLDGVESANGGGGESDVDLGPRLGSVAEIDQLANRAAFDVLVLAAPTYGWQTRLIDQLAGVDHKRPSVLLLPGPFDALVGRMRYRWVSDVPLIEVMRAQEWSLGQPAKRLLDLVIGGGLLVLSLPLQAVCALLVRFTSPGSILYRQDRVGRARKPFTMIKFRTMRENAEQDGEVLAAKDDPRLTPIGGFLRRTRLDELPQLFLVLRGEMSLVGPRPERPGFVAQYLDEVPGYAERFTMSPGLTGLAQVNGDYHSSAENKLRYDLAYIANWSLWLDLSILLRTVKTVLSSHGV